MDLLLFIELLGSGLILLNVYLLTRQNILAWPVGVIAVGLMAYLLYQNGLYAVTLLHIVFFTLNIYGWWYWSTKGEAAAIEEASANVPVTSLKFKEMLAWFLLICLGTITWVYFIPSYEKPILAYIDAFILMGSLVAQYMVARKIIENWMLWIIVNILGIGLYYYTELYIAAGLYFILIFLCLKGFYDWKKDLSFVSRNPL